MPKLELYKGREQTYIKHLFLENYLERVAYNIFSFKNEFVYVDGFSGPWKSQDENYEDTSFKISIDLLRKIREGFEQRGKKVTFKCFFIEKDTSAFGELEKVVGEIDDLEIKIVKGKFENHIDDICQFIGRRFSLIFIDPTGWKGFPLNKITPLLGLRGEVLINFMSGHILRFLEDPRPEIAATFDRLFGGSWFEQWEGLVQANMSREAAAIYTYASRVKKAGNFRHIASTRILKPLSDRTYFHLIYATRHWKGIEEFRKTEKKTVAEQEQVRNAAKYVAKVEKTGQGSLFGQDFMVENAPKSFEQERDAQVTIGHDRLTKFLAAHPNGINYEEVLGHVLETPLVWKSDLDQWLQELKKEDKISIPNMKDRERIPKTGYSIIPISS
jgi:three-Cys-motif partner protein